MARVKKSIWIWIKPDPAHALPTAKALAKALEARGFDVSIGNEPEGHEELAISIGGDGTFLSMVRRLGEQRFRTQVIGIHGSRGIGFLTACKVPSEKDLKSWSTSLAGKIFAMDGEQRNYFGLCATLANSKASAKLGGPNVQSSGFARGEMKRKKAGVSLWAMNDMVIGRTALSRMLSLKLSCNLEVIYEKIKGDGIIFSSAVGSTAYALSAGGPVVDPLLNVVQMTPVCAHPSPQPPMLFGPGSKLRAESLDHSMKALITLDGQEGVEFQVNDCILVEAAPKPVQIFVPEVEARYSCGTYFQALSRLGIGGSHVSGS